ncbi:MAG: hypothetical protein IKM06_04215, partial [Clostridia bacterium]|nr:hypothetical protein [Clostridia bacterium]
MAENNKRSIHSYLTNNTVLKLISLVFALLLWSFVTNSTDTQRTKTIRDVPVVLQGLEALEEKGLTLRDDIEKILPSVDVKVNVNNSDYKLLDKNVIFVSIDVSEINKDGTNSVSVVTTFSNMIDVSLASVEPHTVNVTVDKLATKDVPVTINKLNTLASDLVSFEPVFPGTVRIEGSSYYVERITNAVCDLDLSTLKDGDTASLPCRFTDTNGNTIKFDTVRIDVDPDIQTLKRVNVSTVGAVINANKLKDGFEYHGITVDTVLICGHIDAISTINEVTVQPIDLTDKDEAFTASPIELILPDGVSLAPSQAQPQATIDIREEKQTISKVCMLNVSGLTPERSAIITVNGQAFTVTNGSTLVPVSVTLIGPISVINAITDQDVTVTLSLRDNAPGTYELKPVTILNAAIADEVIAQIETVLSVTVQ